MGKPKNKNLKVRRVRMDVDESQVLYEVNTFIDAVGALAFLILDLMYLIF